jgi:hypothetical protein
VVKYKCEKHGFIESHERARWVKDSIGGPWCVHCLNEMMDKFCGKLVRVEIENGDDSQKTDI